MKRTTVVLPDDVDARLRYAALKRGVSVTTVVREAVLSYVAEPESGLESFIGIARSGESDVAERFDDLLGKALLDEWNTMDGTQDRDHSDHAP